MYAKDITLNAQSYNNVFRTNSGSLHVPVRNSVALYTQFEHVKGTPAEKGERGVSVSRLRLLNTLIDQLVDMRQSVPDMSQIKVDESDMDSLIYTYQRQVKNTVSLPFPGTYGLAGLMPQPGSVFDFCA